MRVYVYAWLTVLCLAAAIRTDSFVVAICASFCAAAFGVWTLREIR